MRSPRSNAPYANFLKALVQRYGPHGSFWTDPVAAGADPAVADLERAEHPGVLAGAAVRQSYVSLLRAAHSAIKSADPGAKVVLAGLPNFSWIAARADLQGPTARAALFDVVAVHPYTKQPQRRDHDPDQGPADDERCRRRAQADDRRRDQLALLAGQDRHNIGFDFATTEAGQARNIAAMLPMLGQTGSALGLPAFYYYTWVGAEQRNALAFDFAGLLQLDIGHGVIDEAGLRERSDRRALALERCRQKGHGRHPLPEGRLAVRH